MYSTLETLRLIKFFEGSSEWASMRYIANASIDETPTPMQEVIAIIYSMHTFQGILNSLKHYPFEEITDANFLSALQVFLEQIAIQAQTEATNEAEWVRLFRNQAQKLREFRELCYIAETLGKDDVKQALKEIEQATTIHALLKAIGGASMSCKQMDSSQSMLGLFAARAIEWGYSWISWDAAAKWYFRSLHARLEEQLMRDGYIVFAASDSVSNRSP